ncbi:hypothetical protein ACFQ22_01740 [Lentilactobacillus raoultii]|uniref:Uncharacterized protein n=1 Tax=Lentilactobacillus raoultii TaxID=1987503 RepID=A0ABW3PI45_9LACO|nr:hypothetical protein [Lentilactobacillus raoultii]
MNKTDILQKLTQLNQIIEHDPVDSRSFQNASTELSQLLLDYINIREINVIIKALGRPLTNEEVADLLIARQNNQPLDKVIHLHQNSSITPKGSLTTPKSST